MLDENDLWVGIVRQAVADCQAGDEDARCWILEYGVPICNKLELGSVSYYLQRIVNNKSIPFVELPKVKKTRRTIWQQHLTDIQNLLQAEPGITQSEIVRRLNIPRGRVVNCVRYLRENKQISNLEY